MNKDFSFEKLKLCKSILSTCLLLSSGLLSTSYLFAQVGQEIHIDEEQISVPVYQNKDGEYIIKSEDIAPDGSQYDSVDIVADADKDGEITISKNLLNGEVGTEVPTVTVNYQTTADLKNYRIVHHYVNYDKNTEYVLSEDAKNLPDLNSDGSRSIADINLEEYKKNTFEGKSYSYSHNLTSYDEATETFTIDVFYLLGQPENSNKTTADTIKDINNMPSKIVNTGRKSTVGIALVALVTFLTSLLMISRSAKTKDRVLNLFENKK